MHESHIHDCKHVYLHNTSLTLTVKYVEQIQDILTRQTNTWKWQFDNKALKT